MTDEAASPGKALDSALSALRDELKETIHTAIKAEMGAAKSDILNAINGGIERLRIDLNIEFAKHRIPVKLATKARQH